MDVTQLAAMAPKSGQAKSDASGRSDETAFSETFETVGTREKGGDKPTAKPARSETAETADAEGSDASSTPPEVPVRQGPEHKVPEAQSFALIPDVKMTEKGPKGANVSETTSSDAPNGGPLKPSANGIVPNTSVSVDSPPQSATHLEGAKKPDLLVLPTVRGQSLASSLPRADVETDIGRSGPEPEMIVPPVHQSDARRPAVSATLIPQSLTDRPVPTPPAMPVEAETPVPTGEIEEPGSEAVARLAGQETARKERPVADATVVPALATTGRQTAEKGEHPKPVDTASSAPDAPPKMDSAELTADTGGSDTTRTTKAAPIMPSPPIAPAVAVDPLALPADTRGDLIVAEVTGGDPVRSEASRSAGLDPQVFNRPETPRLIVQQVVDVIRSTRDGTLEVTLRPEELGRLSLTFNGDGSSLTVSLSADRPETLDLLKRNLTLLEQDLRDLGYDALNFAFEGGEGQDGKPDTRENTREPTGSSPVPDPVQDVIRPLAAMKTGGGIDLRL